MTFRVLVTIHKLSSRSLVNCLIRIFIASGGKGDDFLKRILTGVEVSQYLEFMLYNI